MTTEITGRWLVGGSFEGEVLRLDEALSFWGGVDPAVGTIIDQSHPQLGQALANKIVAMPGSRGSSGTPGVLGETLRAGVGPAALILTHPDVNIVSGSLGAATLYGSSCPVVVVSEAELQTLRTGDLVQGSSQP